MSSPEERAVHLLHEEIVERLNLRNSVIDVYYSQSNFSDDMYEYILDLENPREQNEVFLRELLQNGAVNVFIEALEYQNTHGRLALKLQNKIAELRRSTEILQDPPKIDSRCVKMKKMVRINFRLREITSRGKQGHEQFRHLITAMRNTHQQDSDVLFHMFDAESAFLRVFYQHSVDQEHILNNMELLVHKTKHPTASQMVYLARKGSYIAMKGDLEMRLSYLQRAKTFASQLRPCKDTGMVQYAETNMLLQKYEKHPDPETKEQIIRNTNCAVEYDFSEEHYSVKEDYTKMMNLKLAFCYLGVSCLCDVIHDWSVADSDILETEECLKRISSLPGELYNRHLMFYTFAKSVLSFRKGNQCDAVMFAKQAENLATESSYMKELEKIQLYINRIGYRCIQEESTSFTYC